MLAKPARAEQHRRAAAHRTGVQTHVRTGVRTGDLSLLPTNYYYYKERDNLFAQVFAHVLQQVFGQMFNFA